MEALSALVTQDDGMQGEEIVSETLLERAACAACRDGSTKCDAFYTGDTEDEVVGVVFEIRAWEKPALDLAEGFGNGYSQVKVCVEAERGWLEVFT